MDKWIEQARRLGTQGTSRPGDIEAQIARVHGRRRARARRRAMAGSLAVLAIAASLAATGVGSGPARVPPRVTHAAPTVAIEAARPSPPVVEPPVQLAGPGYPSAASGVLSLGDGSVVTPLGQDSKLLARSVSETEVTVSLAQGSARFDVPDRKTRQFHADVGLLALETHGAAFRVRITRPQVEVITERGQVIVKGSRWRHVVIAGETVVFPMAVPAAPPPSPRAEPAPPAEPARAWRDAADRGDYAAAWAELERTRPAMDSMEDLLLAGDVARLSGHPDAAVGRLARAVALHPDDPRAPLAAFTLGRVRLEDLGAPRDAALAFARALELAPDGPLAEDALAREVEAWSRAGETETARARAVAYSRRYPDGRRLRAVRRFGGLEPP